MPSASAVFRHTFAQGLAITLLTERGILHFDKTLLEDSFPQLPAAFLCIISGREGY